MPNTSEISFYDDKIGPTRTGNATLHKDTWSSCFCLNA